MKKADLGVAFDGDLTAVSFDHHGNFIPAEYVVGLLAGVFLTKEAGATIVHDPRVVWNTIDVVSEFGGRVVVARQGMLCKGRNARCRSQAMG